MLHHGHNGVVVQCGEPHLRHDTGPLKHLHHVPIPFPCLVQQDKGLLRQRRCRDFFQRRQRMILRQHRHQLVLRQTHGFQVGPCGKVQEAAVRPALHDPLLDLRIRPHENVKVNVGIVLLESADHIGQPVGGHAGKCADGHRAGHKTPHLPRYLAALLRLRHHLPEGRQQAAAFVGGGNALAAPAQQWKAHLRFQRRHHAADAGNGIAHGFRRRRDRALVDGAQQNTAFFAFHVRTSNP